MYAAAVILPKTPFPGSREIKDSKQFTSSVKLRRVAKMIESGALAWNVQYVDAEEIDRINIRQSVLKAMRESIRGVVSGVIDGGALLADICVLVDGNDFPAALVCPARAPVSSSSSVGNHDNEGGKEEEEEEEEECAHRQRSVRCVTIERGDRTYLSIAAASILAKAARDEYIAAGCAEHAEWKEKYGMDKHKGYATKRHLDAIARWGLTSEHRKTFGPCKRSSGAI